MFSLLEGAIIPWGDPTGNLRRSIIPGLAEAYEFKPNTPWGELSEEARDAILHGSGKMKLRFPYTSGSVDTHYEDFWDGVVVNVQRRFHETKSDAVRDQLSEFMSTLPCTACGGSRLRAESRSVTVAGKALAQIVELSVGEALEWVRSTPLEGDGRELEGIRPLSEPIAGPIMKEVGERLGFLENVGLGYLTLGRSADTLSGGEAQRIRLATQIGSRLVGVLYILDEPSIGLHQRDNERLLETLRSLRDLGNTVLVVEHDEDTIRAADYIVDLGPGGRPRWRRGSCRRLARRHTG